MHTLKLKKNLLLSFLIVVCLSVTGYSQVQTTFTRTGNIITVKAKTSQTYVGDFTMFDCFFRYLNSNGVNLSVTSSTYTGGQVILINTFIDPNNPAYSIARFGFSNLASSSSINWISDNTEYPIFSFQVNGGLGTNQFSLVSETSTTIAWIYYQLGGGTDMTNYANPFYSGVDNLNISTIGSWTYAKKDLFLGKYWLTTGTSDWNTGSNWSEGTVPVIGNDIAIIPGGTQPIAGAASVCNKLSIESGASVEVAYNGNLTTNDNLMIADNNSLIIKSTAAGTGSLITNGIVTSGNIVISERYISKDNKWHFISAPVAGQLITPNFAPNPMNTSFDFYKWDESLNMMTGNTWVNLRSAPTTLNPLFETTFSVGRGYLVAYDAAYSGSANHSFAGTLGNGDQNISVTNSNNLYNLIGNPYPSAIDWDAAANSGRTTCLGYANPSIWIWNETIGNYGAYTSPIGANGVTNIIAPNQGFFVLAAAAGSFTIPNSARVHPGTQTFLKSTPTDMIRLLVNSTANTYSDELVVSFDANTTSLGTAKWFSILTEAPSLYTVKNNKNYTINTLTGITANLTVPVAFKAGVNGNYTIKASDLNSFTTATYIYLKDLNTGVITDLNQNAIYSFAANTNDNTDRFQLIFSYAPLAVSNNVIEHTSIFAYDNTITVNSNESIQQIHIYNTLGQLIKTVANTTGTITINMNGYSTGYYIVKLLTDKNVYSEKVLVK